MQDAETKEEEEQEQEVVVEEEKTKILMKLKQLIQKTLQMKTCLNIRESVKKRISKLTNRLEEEERQKQSALNIPSLSKNKMMILKQN